jgi:heme-degrading monooxygenase HmoA
MISRIWHGYTRPGNADAYEALLRDEIITGIEDRSIDGFRDIQVFRRDLADEVEFITVMWFDSLDAVRAFAGEDYETSVVPPGGPQAARTFRRAIPALRSARAADPLTPARSHADAPFSVAISRPRSGDQCGHSVRDIGT